MTCVSFCRWMAYWARKRWRRVQTDIVGARITAIHSTFEVGDCTIVYFTVDRGFSFSMPVPGCEWQTCEIPYSAEAWADEIVSESYKVEGSWPSMRFIPEAPTTIDIVKRIKQRTIVGVYCRRMDERLGFYDPDDSLLLFDDGSQASCITVAPHGTGQSGLHYRTDVDQLPKVAELVDFYSVPLDQ
jgi:hypothetical protein